METGVIMEIYSTDRRICVCFEEGGWLSFRVIGKNSEAGVKEALDWIRRLREKLTKQGVRFEVSTRKWNNRIYRPDCIRIELPKKQE